MAKLTSFGRKRLPKADFALPAKRSASGGEGGYPIENKPHAKDALARIDQNGTPAQKSEVREKVERKFPGMEVKGGEKKQSDKTPEAFKGGVPRGEHHQASHRAPVSHEEFHKLGNPKNEDQY